jgi:toxin ParE1/3/4
VKYSVHLIIDAEDDIWDVYRHVARNDSVEKADRLLDSLEKTILGLENLPLRGHYPPELERIGVLEFREIFYKPYRIIYQIIKSDVYVHCVIDGRRDLTDLLQERLLR